MCCQTHDERDRLDKANGIDVAGLLAPSDDFRCRCSFGVPCRRAMTQEDLLCDWCRGRDHQRACDDMLMRVPIVFEHSQRVMPGFSYSTFWPRA